MVYIYIYIFLVAQLFCLIWLVKKTILWLVFKPSIKLGIFKLIWPIWLSRQIDQMSKWLIFCLVFQSNRPWFPKASTKFYVIIGLAQTKAFLANNKKKEEKCINWIVTSTIRWLQNFMRQNMLWVLMES